MFLRGRRRDNPGLATAARPTIPDVVAWEIHRRAVTDGDAGAWALLARDAGPYPAARARVAEPPPGARPLDLLRLTRGPLVETWFVGDDGRATPLPGASLLAGLPHEAVAQLAPMGDDWLAAWALPRGDVLLDLAEAAGVDPRRVTAAACDLVARALPLLPPGEERPARALDATRAWLRGDVPASEREAAAERARALVGELATSPGSSGAAREAAEAVAWVATGGRGTAARGADVAAWAAGEAARLATVGRSARARDAQWAKGRALEARDQADLVRAQIPVQAVLTAASNVRG